MPYAHPILDIQGITSWEFATVQSMISLLLVIVSVNVAILIYARTATRQGEIAVRTALGASRGRLVGQLFIEALVLAACRGRRRPAADAGRPADGPRDHGDRGRAAPVLRRRSASRRRHTSMSRSLTLVAAVISGVLPALQATGRRMQTTLREFGGRSGMRLGRTWTTLIVAQVALAVAGLPIAFGGFWSSITDASTTLTFETAAVSCGDDLERPGTAAGRRSRILSARLRDQSREAAGRSHGASRA